MRIKLTAILLSCIVIPAMAQTPVKNTDAHATAITQTANGDHSTNIANAPGDVKIVNGEVQKPAATTPAAKDTAKKPETAKKVPDPVMSKEDIYHMKYVDEQLKPLMLQVNPLLSERNEIVQRVVSQNPGYEWVVIPGSFEGLMTHEEANAQRAKQNHPPAKK